MNTPRQVMITGGKGLLGTPTAARFATAGATVTALAHTECDITQPGQVTAAIDKTRPELIVHCAAHTKVDDCEADPNLALHINAYGAAIVARECHRRGIRLFHLSTDYVFDGSANQPYSENDQTGPAERLCAYGRSKLAAEKVVASENPDALIIRTAWLYGHDGPCFPQTLLKQARAGRPLRVVNDQTGSPTYAVDLADAIFRLALRDAKGVVHVVNSGTCTWYDFAREILRIAAIDVSITPLSTAEFPRPARRPAWSVLSTQKYVRLSGHGPRSWQDAIDHYLRLSS